MRWKSGTNPHCQTSRIIIRSHRRQRRRDRVHDDLVEVAAIARQGPRDNAEDGEDQEARDQR